MRNRRQRKMFINMEMGLLNNLSLSAEICNPYTATVLPLRRQISETHYFLLLVPGVTKVTMESEKKFLSERESYSLEGIKIYTANGDIGKRWFVSFYPEIAAGVRRRKRVYDNINSFSYPEKRMIRALEVCSMVRTGKFGGMIRSETSDVEIVIRKSLSQKKYLLRKKSFQTYESQIKIFSAWLRKNKIVKVDHFTPEQASDFLMNLFHSGYSATTANNYRENLRALFSTVKKAGVISSNPFDNIQKFQEERRGSLYFKPEQVMRLKNVLPECDTLLWMAVQYIYYCFIRPGELRCLQVSDVYLAEGKIRLRSAISKNKKTEYVSIPDKFMPVLQEMKLHLYPENYFLIGNQGTPGETPIGSRILGAHHLKILRALHFRSGYTLYSWKHTGVIAAHRSGVTLKELQMQLRHHSLDMVAIYLKSLGLQDFGNLQKKFPEL